jgi:IgGFc binding protein
MKSHIGKLISILLCLLTMHTTHAQIDKEFWFAAPELQVMHGDDPIVLRITAQDKPVNITISQPANTTFQPILVSVAANSSVTVDLSPFKNQIEHTEKDVVSNKGLHITGDNLFSCYYDIPDVYNGDLFSLKGKNAMGFQFTVPLQRLFSSYGYPNYTTDFIILATENNTTVTITPSQNLLNHPAGIPFTIVLDKGESFACQNASNIPAEKPGGTKIIADKKVVVTTKDDSLYYPGYSCGDTAGDQLIPDDIAGTDFIIIKGRLYQNDYYYVYAIKNETVVKINNNVVDTLQSGEYYVGQLAEPSCFIETNAPVQVFHMTGFGCELGGAVVPALKCTGSTNISITRATNQDFFFNILAPANIIDGFTINGSNRLTDITVFGDVPSTNGTWKFARLSIPLDVAAAGQVATVVNTKGKFHLGVIHGDQGSTTRYGYFSDFSSTSIRFENYNPPFCLGAPISKSPILIVGASDPIAYQWYRNANPSNTGGTVIQGATDSAYTVPLINNTVGTTYYYVEVQGVCGNVTSPVTPIIITPNTIVNASIAQPSNVCLGDSAKTLQVNATGDGTLSYQWFSNSINSIAGAVPIAGAITPFLKPDSASIGTTYYFAQVLGTCGGDTTNIIRFLIEDCSLVCTYPKDYYGDDDDDNDHDNDDHDRYRNKQKRDALIKQAVAKWYAEAKGLTLGGKDRFVRINSYSRDLKWIQELLEEDGRYAGRISGKYGSVSQMFNAGKDKRNALLQETLTLALNIGLNWNWQYRSIDSLLLKKVLLNYCKKCKIENEDDDYNDDKFQSKNKSNRNKQCLPEMLYDRDLDGKITPRDIFLIANEALNGNEELRMELTQIKNLVCAINHHFSCIKDKDDEDDHHDDHDKQKGLEKGTQEVSIITSPNPFSNQLNLTITPSSTGKYKIELFDQFNRKIQEMSVNVLVPNKSYTTQFNFTSNGMNKIIYRVSKDDWSKSGWIFKQ